MITGGTNGNDFIIGTPTKCGTTTIEALAKRHQRDAGAEHDTFRLMDWDHPRRQHRMALPPAVSDAADIDVKDPDGDRIVMAQESAVEEWGGADRWLFVRNPYTRYMSVYTYLSAPANYSQWGARVVQGREWGGHDESKVIDSPKMDFESFLIWLAQQRELNQNPTKRGDLNTGFAYRSPWVWTDSLSMSAEMLFGQPGAGEPRGFLRLETIWGDLESLLREYGIAGEVSLGGLHANRTTGYGDGGAVPGSRDFWGGIACSSRVFKKRKFRADAVRDSRGCRCGACVIGVAREAAAVGYLG